MDQVKLTITITAILSAIVLIAQNCFGIILFADTDPGTIAGAAVTIIVAAFGAWKAIAEYIAKVRANILEEQNAELKKELVSVKAQAELFQTKYEKAISGLRV